jgi:hypothetical protein
MDSEDWRHLDNYWRPMYGENYPRDRESGRYSSRGSGNERANTMGWADWMTGPNPYDMSAGSYAGRGPRNYKRSDERILEDINERLTHHPLIDATEIEVSVQEGEVILRGSVDQREAKRRAEDVADSVSGVKNVRNELRVQQPQSPPDKDKKGGWAA